MDTVTPATPTPPPPEEKLSISTIYSAEEIHQHRDIRKQTIEQAEQLLAAKRVRRLITVQKHMVVKAAKADKMIEKNLTKFQRQTELFDNAMAAITEKISKAETYLAKMQELNHELENDEATLL